MSFEVMSMVSQSPKPHLYPVNEIFYSLQGEGLHSGTPMVFLRFSGCNLRCPFCDTDFSGRRMMDAPSIIEEMTSTLPPSVSSRGMRVCLTGGEPSLFIDDALVGALHAEGFILHIETNGTHPLPGGIDWVTLSPKCDFLEGGEGVPVLERADELKLVYTAQEDIDRWLSFPAGYHFLQPCSCKNTSQTVQYILDHPGWSLSLQTHKYLDIR